MSALRTPVVFYDGVCGFCHGAVRFILKHDPRGVFRFAPLQGELAAEVLPPLDADPKNLDTLYVLTESPTGEREVRSRARAAFFIARQIGYGWLVLPWRVLPWRVLDWGYDLFAKYRYRLFGRKDACDVPDAAERARFI